MKKYNTSPVNLVHLEQMFCHPPAHGIPQVSVAKHDEIDPAVDQFTPCRAFYCIFVCHLPMPVSFIKRSTLVRLRISGFSYRAYIIVSFS